MSDQIREAFEAAMVADGYGKPPRNHDDEPYIHRRDRDRFEGFQLAWNARALPAVLAAPSPPQAAPTDLAHQIWAAAQLGAGEGIVDGVDRVAQILAAQAEPQQPVAWIDPDTRDVITDERKVDWMSNYGTPGESKAQRYTKPLYAAPAAQQELKPLSSQRAREIAEAYYDPAMDEGDLVELVRCVEEAHRIGSPEGERTCD